MKLKLYLPLIFCILFSCSAVGQHTEKDTLLDELSEILNSTKVDTVKISTCIKISSLYGTKPEAEMYAKYAYDLAKPLNYSYYHAITNGALADYYYSVKNYNESQKFRLKEFDIWSKKKNTLKATEVSFKLGELFQAKNYPEKALYFFTAAEENYNDMDLLPEVSDCKLKLGILQSEIGEFAEALLYFKEVLRIQEHLNNQNEIADTYLQIGIVHNRLGNPDLALNNYGRTVEVSQKIDYHAGQAAAYNQIGNLERDKGNLNQALGWYEKSIEYWKKSEDQLNSSETYNNIGTIYLLQNDAEKALEFFFKSAQTKIEYKDSWSLTRTYINMSEAYDKLGDTDKALGYLELAKNLANLSNDTENLLHIYMGFGKYESQLGNHEDATEYLKKYIELSNSLEDSKKSLMISVLSAKYEHERHINEIQILADKNAELNEQKEKINKEKQLSSKQNKFLILLSVLLVVMVIVAISKAYSSRRSARKLVATNEMLTKTLISKEEKETLIKEIHHRVKNNLQIIKSLIRLQMVAADDEKVNTILNEFELRVSSMALVHEELYKSKDLTKVSVQTYLEGLVTDLVDAYKVGQEIETDINIEVTTMGVNTLIPLGLLVNEIISNAIKHGLKERVKGKITCIIQYDDYDQYKMFIGDDGKGFPDNFNLENETTLGLELIQALSEQLEGEIKVVNENGAYYEIRFKNLDK